MAPEQWRGNPVHQTDIYALGVVFYELVTGRKPYTADTPTAIAVMQMVEPLPRPSEFVPDLPEEVEKTVYKALAIQPEDRYESMGVFYSVLEDLGKVEEVEERELEEAVEVPAAAEIPITPEHEPISAEPSFTVSVQETSDDYILTPVGKPGKKRLPGLWIGLGAILAVIVIGSSIGVATFRDEIAELGATETATMTVTSTSTLTATTTGTSTVTKTHTLTLTPTSTPTFEQIVQVREKDNMEMVYIPPGEFEMGSEDGDDDESPVHTVYLDAYWIDKYEVTNAQYALCVQAGECDVPDTCSNYGNAEYDDHPVVCVTWYDAQTYAEWVGGRLPTEAEWEKAARGGLEGQRYPWGNEEPVCTLGAENGVQLRGCEGETVEVGSFAPNGYGLFDMAGNVWERVADWYADDYYKISPTENPQGPSRPSSGNDRVLRGGSFYDRQSAVHCASRGGFNQFSVSWNLGFRVVISP
jgi:serine/threonine-protein kinase